MKDTIELERILLGSVIADGERTPKGWNVLDGSFFTDPRHQQIYAAINLCSLDNFSFKIAGVVQELSNNDHLQDAGGAVYLSELTNTENTLPISDLYNTCLFPIVENYRQRKMKSLMQDLGNALDHGQSYQKITNELLEVTNLLNTLEKKTAKTPTELIQEDRQEQANKPSGIDTGIKNIPKLYKDELTIIGARPSVGKTSLMVRMMLEISKNHKVAFFSLESSSNTIMKKILACLSGVSVNKQREHFYVGKDEENLEQARIKFEKEYNILLDADCSHDLNKLLANIRNLVVNENCEVVFIDYLGCINTKGSNSYETTTEISKQIKALNKSLNVPFVVASQLARTKKEDGTIPKPTLQDLRQSGQIEQDADNIILLHDSGNGNDEKGNAERTIIIGKERNGDRKDTEYLFKFNGLRCTFECKTKLTDNKPSQTPADGTTTSTGQKKTRDHGLYS